MHSARRGRLFDLACSHYFLAYVLGHNFTVMVNYEHFHLRVVGLLKEWSLHYARYLAQVDKHLKKKKKKKNRKKNKGCRLTVYLPTKNVVSYTIMFSDAGVFEWQ